MEVHFSQDVQRQLDKLAAETGRASEDFVQDAMAGYFEELQRARGTIDRRYGEMQSGKVELIDGEDAFARLKAKAESRHQLRT